MKNITVETKSNGYKAEGIQSMIGKFETAAAQLFPGCTVRHFYYGDALDMADVVLEPGRYAHFNVTAKRVSLCGYITRFIVEYAEAAEDLAAEQKRKASHVMKPPTSKGKAKHRRR